MRRLASQFRRTDEQLPSDDMEVPDSLKMNRQETTSAKNNPLPPQGRKKYRDCAQRIVNIVAQYDTTELLDYLRGLAHNYNF